MPSPAMSSDRPVSSPPQIASQMSFCSSSSDGTGPPLGRLHGADAVGIARLGEKYRQRGKIRVPLNQRWLRPEAVERVGIEVPHGLRDGGAVIVEQDAAAVDIGAMIAGEMDLADR